MKTDIAIAIVGGGPAGLMLAIELGCRDVPCVLFEKAPDPPRLPKANATSARTMEHYRRRGFAQRVRALGLPPDYPQDIVYRTRLTGPEMTRFRIPSRNQTARQEWHGDYGADRWPTPELPHRAQQMFIEAILREEAARYPSVNAFFGVEVNAIEQDADGVTIATREAAGGRGTRYRARYVIGCDGPRSVVRKAMGTAYEGHSAERRDFLGGQMLTLYIRAPALYQMLGKERAWQYWALNPVRRGVMVAVNGVDTFAFLAQLAEGQELTEADQREHIEQVVGKPFEFDIIAASPWIAGHALVAERFRRRRLMIAGDAAHLFTPTGGMGYNTSVDDAVNLGWKLAAVEQRWAPDALLDTYEIERRPIALRNTAFARRMADSIGRMPVTQEVAIDGPTGDEARANLGDALARHVFNEFNIPGLQLGLRYTHSAIVAREAGDPPPDAPNHYVPSGYPGARAPHVTAGNGSLFDYFGRGFTLLCTVESRTDDWEKAAAALEIPLTVVTSIEDPARAVYGADLVLVRPDHHIAWRGDGAAIADDVLRMASGARLI